jgi:hypothetical protein
MRDSRVIDVPAEFKNVQYASWQNVKGKLCWMYLQNKLLPFLKMQ